MRRVARGLQAAFIEDAPLVVLLALFGGTAFLLHTLLGKPAGLELDIFSWWLISVVLVYLLPAFIVSLVYEVVGLGKKTLALDTWRSIVTRLFAPRCMAGLVVVLVVFPTFMEVFIALKSAIPSFVPFGPWDVRFMEWDRWLHLGRHPWELLFPLLSSPKATWAIDRLYALWFLVLWMTTVWQAWHGDRTTELRSQYLFCFALCWVLLGTVAATLLSSAGPVFFARVTGAEVDPFAALVAHLHAVDASGLEIKALWGHEYLWEAYTEGDPRLFAGISAMPSLHVSTATLMAILGFKTNRWLGGLYALFALIILIGSVHLAWHYAIDGYVAIVATLGLWWISGVIVRWWRARTGLDQLSADAAQP